MMKDYTVNMKYWRDGSSKKKKSYEEQQHVKPGPKRVLTQWSEFLMTLIWIRLNLPVQLLSGIYGQSVSHLRKTAFTWVQAMRVVLVPILVKWPSQETVRDSMPKCFKDTYPDTRVIIDCTEIPIQKPRNPDAQHKTYSTYKSRNTIKLLVGITPTGAFSFISKAWSGNVSDKYITKNSGMVELLEPGDQVMADRGFQIEDILLGKGVKLIAPPFTRKCATNSKQKRLNANEIIETRRIALLRIHVERAIERMKRWEILRHIPLVSVPISTELVLVVGAFCNLLPPLVED